MANAGVLFLLPFLKESGLLSYKRHYEELSSGYYYIDIIVLFLALMYLCRIKNIEQLKNHNPGELGKLVGLDRIPEQKCFRKKIHQIVNQKKSLRWMTELSHEWVAKESPEFYYIDGHVQVYHGYKAILGKKHVSRQKLCLPGMQEFWVNNHQGQPYFFVTGVVNEKLLEMLRDKIIPRIKQLHPPQDMAESSDLLNPLFTIVFDREAYSPEFFGELWENDRIAVLSYRKNAYEKWPAEEFSEYTTMVDGLEVKMELAEREIVLSKVSMREIRKKGKNEHQTSILTTNRKLTLDQIAIYMFARWTQENFFKYLRQNYDMDKIIQYAVDQIDQEFMVVNPAYSKADYKVKKTREKIVRRRAKLFELQQSHSKDEKLKNSPKHIARQAQTLKELNEFLEIEQQLLLERKGQPYKIKIKQMPEQIRYTSLRNETKAFQNIIKMICYRAETAMAFNLKDVSKKYLDEKRAIVKSIIQTTGNIIPNYQDNTLLISLYTQTNPRTNKCVAHLCDLLNKSKTKFPGTELVLKYEIAT